MKSMLKNACKAAKIKIVKTTALHHQSKVSRLRPAVNSSPVQEMKNLKYLQNQKKNYENIFLLSLRKHHFINQTMKSLGPTPPFLHLKNCCIFTPVQQIRPSQRPVVACYRDAYAPTSRKYVSNEPLTRSFQQLNNKILRAHSPAFIFTKLWCFDSNSAKANLSDTCGGSFQRHVCTNVQKYASTEPQRRSFQ